MHKRSSDQDARTEMTREEEKVMGNGKAREKPNYDRK